VSDLSSSAQSLRRCSKSWRKKWPAILNYEEIEMHSGGSLKETGTAYSAGPPIRRQLKGLYGVAVCQGKGAEEKEGCGASPHAYEAKRGEALGASNSKLQGARLDLNDFQGGKKICIL